VSKHKKSQILQVKEAKKIHSPILKELKATVKKESQTIEKSLQAELKQLKKTQTAMTA
jgi:cell division protein FtsB